jgi:ketosteroid isomerase-like protein
MNSPTDTVRDFYAALNRADAPAVLSLMTDDVRWTETPRFPYYSGTWVGPQQVLDRLLIPASNDWDGFGVTVDRYIAEGTSVVALGFYHGVNRASGKALNAPLAHVWSVDAGRIASFTQYTDTAMVLEAMS